MLEDEGISVPLRPPQSLVITDYKSLSKEPYGILSLTVINEELEHGRPFYV
jgi:hypothetical protein